VLIVVALLAALVYALVWTIERRRTVGGFRLRRPRRTIVAPDDDEDFLRSLRPEDRDHDGDDPEDPRPA
jgi:hypothetical protein